MSDFLNKYPYTDFHELNLDWVIERVKKLTEDWAATLTEWNSTEEEWHQLYDYVHDYFDNLDVQQEINNKIDQMILDGTFATIATPIIENQVIATTTAWLADHISQPTTPAIDNTLSIIGAAADAYNTGRMTADLYSASNTYKVGQYVNHNGHVYRCITAITTPEAWNVSHWTIAFTADELYLEILRTVKSSKIFINSAALLAQYPSIDSLPTNSICICDATYGVQMTNAPYTNSAFFVITFEYSNDANHTVPGAGAAQIAIPFGSVGNNMMFRSNGGSWTSWYSVGEPFKSIRSANIFVNSSAMLSAYPSVASLPVNSICICDQTYGSQMTDAPYKDCAFTIMSFVYNNNANLPPQSNGETQIAIPFASGQNQNIKYRSYSGSWTAWKCVEGHNTYYADNTNFIEVIAEAVNTQDSIVYLAAGTYYVFDSDHDEAYWISHRPATRYCGIQLNNGIKLIGLGDVLINAEYSGSDSDIKENFSVFNIGGNFHMENIKILAENICYCVHDDQGAVSYAKTIGDYKNCYMTHNGSDHVFLYGAPVCIGGGCSTPYIARTIQDCVFSAPTQPYSVSYHSNDNCYGEVIIKDNYFIDGSIRIWKYVGGNLTALINNNSLETAVDEDAALTIYNWNNEIRP